LSGVIIGEPALAHVEAVDNGVAKRSHGRKAHDLIASPAFLVMRAADEFKDKTTAPNQL
jgi:hypothetical protein